MNKKVTVTVTVTGRDHLHSHSHRVRVRVVERRLTATNREVLNLHVILTREWGPGRERLRSRISLRTHT